MPDKKNKKKNGPSLRKAGVIAAATGATLVGVAALARRSGADARLRGLFGAHRADGQDDSAGYSAGIADEGTIPEATPEPVTETTP